MSYNSLPYENKLPVNTFYQSSSNKDRTVPVQYENSPPWQKNRNNLGPGPEARLDSNPWNRRPLLSDPERSSLNWNDKEDGGWNQQRSNNMNTTQQPQWQNRYNARVENVAPSNQLLRSDNSFDNQRPPNLLNESRVSQGSDWNSDMRSGGNFISRSTGNAQSWNSGSRPSGTMDSKREEPQHWNDEPRGCGSSGWEFQSRGQNFNSYNRSDSVIRSNMTEVDRNLESNKKGFHGSDNWINRQTARPRSDHQMTYGSDGNNRSRMLNKLDREEGGFGGGMDRPMNRPSSNPFVSDSRDLFIDKGFSEGPSELNTIQFQNMRPLKRRFDDRQNLRSPFEKEDVWSRLEPSQAGNLIGGKRIKMMREDITRSQIGDYMQRGINKARFEPGGFGNGPKLRSPAKTGSDLRGKLNKAPTNISQPFYRVFIHRETVEKKARKVVLPLHVDFIEKKLVEDLHKIVKSDNIDNQPELQFLSVKITSKKRITVECQNMATVEWLLKWTPPFRNLKVLLPDDIKYGAIISFVVRSQPCKIHPAVVTGMLRTQNQGLETYSWVEGQRTPFKKSTGYKFKVNGHTVRYLRSHNNELFFGLEKVSVTIVNIKGLNSF